MRSQYQQRLIAILRERSVQRGQFTLSSGKVCDLYVDVRQTTLNSDGAALVGYLVLRALRSDVIGIGGLTLGADPVACSAAAMSQVVLRRPIHAFLIRKEAKDHGTGQQVEGLSSLPVGSQVCVVEDVTTTGVSLIRAIQAARAAGLDVIQCLTVVDREEGAIQALAREGLALRALVTRTDLGLTP